MIAGAGFALMAWKLAQERYGLSLARYPFSRANIDMRRRGNPIVEYHRIMDKAAEGHAMLKGWGQSGTVRL